MSEDDWLKTDVARELVRALVAGAVRNYRVEAAEAEKIILESLRGDGRLGDVIGRGGGEVREIIRTRAYKKAATDARRRIYYSLRRYRRSGGGEEDAAERLAALTSLGSLGDETSEARKKTAIN